MEAANRWETEAIRESRDRRSARPTVSQERKAPNPAGDWRTLREVSDETGIPIGTLRKWCRRESVDSYLESDGEQTLRMLEMGSVERNARAMGRELVSSPGEEATGDRRQAEEGRQQTADSQQPEEGRQQTADSRQPEEGRQTPDPSPQPEREAEPVLSTQYPVLDTADAVGTMIVPIDAWNKMLNQLGNLHEAGQQLAEARERAGKAETEAKFLRERLAEMRESGRQADAGQQLTADSGQPETGQQATGDRRQAEEGRQSTADSQQPEMGKKATGDRRQGEESYQPPAASYQQESEPVPSDSGPSSSPGSSSSLSEGGAAAGGGGGRWVPTEDTADPTPVPPAEGRGDAEERSDDAGGQGSPQSPVPGPQSETTSFWRYVLRGWRGRKR